MNTMALRGDATGGGVWEYTPKIVLEFKIPSGPLPR